MNTFKKMITTLILCASTNVMAYSNISSTGILSHDDPKRIAFIDEKTKEYCSSESSKVLKNSIDSDLYPRKGRLTFDFETEIEENTFRIKFRSSELKFKEYCPAKATLHYSEIFKKNNPTEFIEKGFLVYDDMAYPIKNVIKFNNNPNPMKYAHTDNFSVYRVFVSIKGIDSILELKFDHELKAYRFIQKLKKEILTQ